jgi:uncharacterized repeat protein (TIGR01451 family)
MIWVLGVAGVAEATALRADVAHAYANLASRRQVPVAADEDQRPYVTQAVEWNIDWVNAPDVWAAGHNGQGAVIGGQDTGYDWDHAALIDQYRGWNGSTTDHDYNWHDAIHEDNSATGPGNPCGFNSAQPCDDHGHGTHTLGTMVGDDGGSNQVGMAPGASWIGCRNMEQGVGTPATYSECYQWFLAPYPVGGDPFRDGDPDKAPHVINNSWGCPPSEGCTDPNVLLTVVENVRAAGIVTVHSAGNEGPGCSSVGNPATIYDASFSVGATAYSNDDIASFSSRGPVSTDGSNRLKPDISAPGVLIRSTTPNDGYGHSSGTSMAGPHVAGLVALLISAEPALAGQVDLIESIIQQTAVPLFTDEGCGGDTPASLPNHTFGYGRIDALAAFEAIDNLPHALSVNKRASTTAVTAGDNLTYTLTVSHFHPLSPTHNVVLTDVIPANTNFVTATVPYTLDGDTVLWQKSTLTNTATWTVKLAVQVPVTASNGPVENVDYGVKSDETPVVKGTNLFTPVLPSSAHYLPVLTKQ